MTEDPKEELNETYFQMQFLKEEGLFELAWFDRADETDAQSRKYFSVKLLPATFQQMTYDMVRMSKDFNLMQAKEFEERSNGSGRIGDLRIESAICGGNPAPELEYSEEKSEPIEGSPEESKEDKPRTTGEAEAVVQEV